MYLPSMYFELTPNEVRGAFPNSRQISRRNWSGYIYENLRVSSGLGCSGKQKRPGQCREDFVATSKFSNSTTSAIRTKRFGQEDSANAGPLKLEIKSIKNSTRTDVAPVDMDALMSEEESGRSLITAAVLITWIAVWKWKAYISFFIVHSIDFIWTSIKNILGWGNEHYETTITWGHDHPPGHKGHRHGLFHNHHHHGHHHHGHQGWGNPAHNQKKWVYKTKNPWHHPATKLFEQPTYQYLPHGKEYTMMGFDQHQAYKWRRKYGKKFAHYRRKYYRKKHRQVLKAQRRRERERRKAERRKQKAERRKEKWERFKDRVTEVQAFYNKIKNANKKATGSDDDDDDDDGDETNDDLKATGQKAISAAKTPIGTPGTNKQRNGDSKNRKTKDEEDDEKDDLENSKKNEKGDDNDAENDEENDDENEEGDIDKDESDLAYDDKNWEESSSEMEQGPPPRSQHHQASYHAEHDYDPLPVKSKHQKYIRIRLR